MTITHVVQRTDIDLPRALPTSPAEEARACRCGHVEGAHEHYRRGTDCAVCECTRYARHGRSGLFRR